MEGLGINSNFWQRKIVFLTGHTGFKGGWIAHWLSELGASVYGYSLEPPTKPNFFNETQLERRLAQSTIGDIRDLAALANAVKRAKPSIVIHLAAQSLVRESYNTPVETFAANVMGTVNVLEAARQVGSVKVIINVTSDKCYNNKEWCWPYRENDQLGGHDPYSASKACSEIAAAAYRYSFLAHAAVLLANVRAGNVIGGGDWATDRLIPDFFRALDAGKSLSVRSPNSIRPWQHVLEPLSGYLMLAEKLYAGEEDFADAWNFGPNDDDSKSVCWVLRKLCTQIPDACWNTNNAKQVHEANILKLDSSKAKAKLGWAPRWSIETTLRKTIEWHQAWRNREDMAEFTTQQIKTYINP